MQILNLEVYPVHYEYLNKFMNLMFSYGTALLMGVWISENPLRPVSMYYKMAISGSRPNKYTYPPLFKACTLEQAIGEGLQIRPTVVKHGLNADDHIISAGIQMYASLGRLSEARNMLETIGKSELSVAIMIDGYMI
ncbi:UNVERIFIED_CONTAM: Pentatricopeptide repeat-containing protein [Sesamum angustifolium]|uniref:Pentatricopeptide repeat-containing protein n=1 Tax=Sesamum angustifolium TaxID=2727405 RepID=A0AAW2QB09_9LAMI